MFRWFAVLRGPQDTPYDGGFFRIVLVVPETYPMSPPQVYFITPVFHPNVHPKVSERHRARAFH